jgi:hypothetical protein
MTLSAADLVTSALDALNAASTADLAFWAAADLYEWIDEAAKRMARTAQIFVVHDTSVTTAAGTAVYGTPGNHVALINIACLGAMLRPSSSRELAALSDTWMADAGAPARWIEDWLGHDLFRVYPTPTAAQGLEIVLAAYLPDITAAAPTFVAPDVFGDYLETALIAEARRKEGDGALPEVAAALDRQTGLYEQIFQSYWGQP